VINMREKKEGIKESALVDFVLFFILGVCTAAYVVWEFDVPIVEKDPASLNCPNGNEGNLTTFVGGIDLGSIRYDQCIRDYPNITICTGEFKCVEKDGADYCAEACAPRESDYSYFSGNCWCKTETNNTKYPVYNWYD